MSHEAATLWRACLRAGITDAAGVPCSLLGELIGHAGDRYVAASVEGEAVAMAAGSWLAGGLGAAIMQNSGLGNAINPLASLLLPYAVPALLIVSWRGQAGDAAHHHPMGLATPGLLELFGIPHHVLAEDDDLEACVAALVARAHADNTPVALLIPKGTLTRGRLEDKPSASMPPPAQEVRVHDDASPGSLLGALACIDRHLGDRRIVTTTGFTSRTMASRFDRPQHFYMQGSMGFASAIALGLARGTGEPAVIVDGDGALTMRLGSLATLGATGAQALHIVLDNASYASTGGQPTSSPTLDFARAALACGYRYAASCPGVDALELELRGGLPLLPALLHVRTESETVAPAPRPSLTPPEIAARCRAHSQPSGRSR